MTDLALALTNSLAKNGETAPTANLQMAGFKLTSIGDGSAATDSVALRQLQNNAGAYLTSVAGTNTITAVVSPTLTAYAAGQVFSLIPAASNTGAATLNISGVGAKDIFINGAALSGYEIRIGVPVSVLYDGTQFHVISGAYGGGDAIATVKAMAASAAPTGWLLCSGAAVSRTTYADLFAAIATTYGVGDGSTTFNLPDLRGRAALGKDDMGGSAASRITAGVSGITGTTLGAAGGNQSLTGHTHTGTSDGQSANHTHAINISDPGHVHSLASIAVTARALDAASGGGNDFAAGSHLAFSIATIPANTTGITATSGGFSGDHTHTFTSNSTGAGSSQNVPPALVLNFIIKT